MADDPVSQELEMVAAALLSQQNAGAPPNNRRQPGESVDAYRSRLTENRATTTLPPRSQQMQDYVERTMTPQIPEGMVYNPATQQYVDVRAQAEARDRSRTDAAVGGGMQGVSLSFGDEIAGQAIGRAEGLARGVDTGEMADYRTAQLRAQLEADGEQYPWTQGIAQVLGSAFLPAAAISRGAGWLRNGLRLAAAGAGVGGVDAAGPGETLQERIANVPAGMGFGAVGGLAAGPFGALAGWAGRRFGPRVGAIFRSRRFFRDNQLTDEGRRAIEAAGFDPDTLSEQLQREFARNAANAATPEDAARATQLAEFGIPAYRHNVTGNPVDAAEFVAMQRGGRGADAAQRIGDAADAQMGAVRRAGENIATGFSNGRAYDQWDAASGAQQGLRMIRDRAFQDAQNAYGALEAAGGGIRGEAVQGLPQRLQNGLRMANIEVDPRSTPNTAAALEDISRAFAGSDTGSVPFMAIERARQDLVRDRGAAFAGNLGRDRRAMTALLGQFDEAVDNLMTTVMTDGNPEVLQMAQRARGLWRDYSQTFTGDGAAQRFIQKMVDDDASPDDVARWLFSAGRLGSGQFNSTLARGIRDVMGEGSEEWSAIRQAAFRQLISKPEGTTQPGYQQMSQNINRFLSDHTSRDLANTLFSEQERALMRRYSAALRQLVPPEGSVNYSNTGYENARTAQQLTRMLGGMLGFIGTGAAPGGGAAGAMATGALQGAMSRGAISNALSGLPAAPARAPVAAGAMAPAALGGPAATAVEDFRNRY